MREVAPGDIVFSFAEGAIQGFGIARTSSYSCPQPDDFGHIGEVWDKTGWRVDVNFHRFNSSFIILSLIVKQTPRISTPIPKSDYSDGH
jgi:hypothetical protein